MAKKLSSAAQKQIWLSACSDADNLLFHMRRVVPLLLEAAGESERIGVSLTVKRGGYRPVSEPENAQHKAILAELKRRVNWDLWNFVAALVIFERDCKPVLNRIAALYPIHASPIQIWDIRAASGMEAVGRAGTTVLIGMFGADLSILEMVKTRDLMETPVRQELLDRVFPYWPGHFYKPWIGRSASPLLDLEVALRREQFCLVGRDPGPASAAENEDADLPDVSSKGRPLQPTFPMSITQRADAIGLDVRTLKDAMIEGRFRFQRHSSRRFSFCDEEPRPAKRAKSAQIKSRPSSRK